MKAFVHRERLGDIVNALEQAGVHRLSVSDVKSLTPAFRANEQKYSVEVGARVTTEAKLEVFCEDDQVDRIVPLIRLHGRTDQNVAGWVYLSPVDHAWPIDGRD
jgi:nitrogen regulatory protein P-II 1